MPENGVNCSQEGDGHMLRVGEFKTIFFPAQDCLCLGMPMTAYGPLIMWEIFKSKPNSDTGSRLDVATGRGWGWVTWVKGGRPPAPGAAAPVMATGVSHTQLTAY